MELLVPPVASMLFFGVAFTRAGSSSWLYWCCLKEVELETAQITPVSAIDVVCTEGLAADCSQDARVQCKYRP